MRAVVVPGGEVRNGEPAAPGPGPGGPLVARQRAVPAGATREGIAEGEHGTVVLGTAQA